MKKIFNATLVMLVTMVMSLVSCTDNLIQSDNEYIGEGEASVTLDFSFEPQGSALEMRGVNGNLDFGINNLVILFYDENANEVNGSPKYAREYTSEQFDVLDLQVDDSRDQDHCENYTYHGMVTIEGVDYGKYRIYAVANVNVEKIAGTKSDGTKITIDNISEKELRELQIKWPTPTEKGDDRTPLNYGVPDAMFGYFTLDVDDHVQKAYRNVIHHNPNLYNETSIENDKNKDSNRPKAVTLNKRNLQVQAWLKRVVSKLTIGFDGTGLKKEVEIYIKSVRIMDAAESCLLGHDNSVYDKEVGTNFNNTDKKINFLNNEDYAEDLRLYTAYESDEENAVKITRNTPAYPREGFDDNFIPDSKFNETDKDEDEDGWVDNWYNYIHGLKKEYDPTFTGPTYKNQPTTLYFFENLQGIGTKNNSDYDKSLGEGHPNYKDGKPNGTYVEVKAYYKTTKTGKESQGDIIYRFMLGKNITNDFNAERNHHYKLILSFIGDANNVDWHIDYEEEKSNDYYFRIPYNLEDGGIENGFTQVGDTWHKNENWNRSWVWYAYDKDNNPIAEIVKEIIYYDPDYTDKDNTTGRKFYQVVTVYPMKKEVYGDYITDLAKGKIVQVLDCDDSNETAKKFYTRIGGDDITMYYRYERPAQWKNGLNADRAQNCRYTISSCSLSPNVANGTDEENRHEGYHFLKYDHETKEITLIEEPLDILLPTRPYRIEDKDKNLYPVVKIGASYWLRKNLRTTKVFTAAEILGIPYASNSIYDIRPYSATHNAPYCAGVGCIYFDTTTPMYKTLDNDTNGDTYGYLYNIAAIAGSNDFDAWTMNDFQSRYEAWRGYNEECNPNFDPNDDSTWILDPDDLTKEDGDLYKKYFFYYEEGDGGYVGGGLVQLEDRFLDRTDARFDAFNDGQLAPKGWHIPTGAYDRQDARYVTGDNTQPEDYYCWSFGHVWQDHQYLFFYLGLDFFRGAANTATRKWPSTGSSKEITKKNLAGLSLLPIPVDGHSTDLSYNPIGDSWFKPNPKLEKAIIPYVTNSFLAYDVPNLKDAAGEKIIGSLAILPPVFDNEFAGFSDYRLESDEIVGVNGLDEFFINMSKQYLPVRLVRNSFPESYAAQPYEVLDKGWSWVD